MHADLELSLHRRGEGGYVVEMRFVPPDSDADVRISPDQAAVAPIDLTRLRQVSMDDRAYGRALSEMLFAAPAVLSGFSRARSVAQSQSVPLRVRIYIGPGADDLHGVRWESLRDPETDAPLCTGDGLIFSRYLTSLDWQPVRPRPRGSLRALVAIANPQDLEATYGLAPVDVAGELARVEQGLAGVAAVTALAARGSATLERIETTLRAGPDLFILIAHGALRREEPTLYLEQDSGAVDPVAGASLADVIQGLRVRPGLIFLLSCQSAGSGNGQALAALGPRLAKVGAPAVLAMQGNITMESAAKFLPAFFAALRDDGRVDGALAAARAAIRRRPDWWMPVLFSRSRSGQIWAEAAQAPARLDGAKALAALDQLAAVVPTHGPGLGPEFARYAEAMRALAASPRVSPDSREAREVRETVAELDRIVAAIYGDEVGFAQLAAGQAPALAEPVSPFPGLGSFRQSDARFFFGREELTAALVRRLQAQRFLAVLGASGSGKSSLALAGVLPALLAAEPGLAVAELRPGADPLARWEAGVAPLLGRPLVLVVDQFEEIFTLCADEAARRTFFTRMLDLARSQRVMVTMRADFWGEVAPYAALRQAMQACQELVAPMAAEDLRRAMEQQVAAAGLRLEPGLGQIVLEDVAGEPGAMPLLQHALRELWRQRHGRWLRTSAYRAVGGVQQAIAQSAEQFYSELGGAEQELARHLFVRLTRVEVGGGGGVATRDTRRRVLLADLPREGDDPAVVRALIERLASARLLVTGQAEAGVEVEVAHEALIRRWPRLRAWLDASRADLVLFETLRTASEEWQQADRPASLLVHRGDRVDRAEKLLARPDFKPTATMRRYFRACVVAREREKELENTQRLKRLSEMGWGVIFPAVEEGQADPYGPVRAALAPLLELRKRQAGMRYREFSGPKGYRPGETKSAFLGRNGVGSGPPNPRKVPYYLLIVGSPEEIPFLFQYQLDVQYGVGRIHFDSAEEYARYARSVVAAELSELALPRRAGFLATSHEGDQATEMSCQLLAEPLAAQLQESNADWAFSLALREAATRPRALALLGGAETPALLFSATHGIALPLGDGWRDQHLGALLTQDWESNRSVDREHYLAAEDIGDEARLLGTVAFFWSAYSAGVPRLNDFIVDGSKQRPVAPHDMIAALPQRLLSHPQGGALAVIGRIDTTWISSFRSDGAGSAISHFVEAMERLLDGYPVGAAMDLFNQRYSELAAEHAELLMAGSESDPKVVTRSSLAARDARNYLVIGDPAVRVVVGESAEPAPRPTLAELEERLAAASAQAPAPPPAASPADGPQQRPGA